MRGRFEAVRANRPYIRGSVMTLSIVVAITISGVFRLSYPGSVTTTSVLQALPAWVVLWLNLAWIGSGSIVTVGIVSGDRRAEGAGLILMTSAFLAYYVAILFFKGEAALSVIYIFGYSIGAAARAYIVLSARLRMVVLTVAELAVLREALRERGAV